MRNESPRKKKAYRALSLMIGEMIAKGANRLDLTPTALAKKAGVSQGNLARMITRGECCLQFMALYQCAKVMKIPITKILPTVKRFKGLR